MNIHDELDEIHKTLAPINFSLLLMRHRRVLKIAKVQRAIRTLRQCADRLEKLIG